METPTRPDTGSWMETSVSVHETARLSRRVRQEELVRRAYIHSLLSEGFTPCCELLWKAAVSFLFIEEFCTCDPHGVVKVCLSSSVTSKRTFVACSPQSLLTGFRESGSEKPQI